MLDQGQMNANSGSEAEIVFIGATISNYDHLLLAKVTKAIMTLTREMVVRTCRCPSSDTLAQ